MGTLKTKKELLDLASKISDRKKICVECGEKHKLADSICYCDVDD